MNVLQDIARTQTIKPVRPANQVVYVRKNDDGGLLCRQASGNEFTIPANELEMQAFVMFTVIHAREL